MGNDLKQAGKRKKNVNYSGLGGNRKITTNHMAISDTYKDIEGVRGSFRKEENDGRQINKELKKCLAKRSLELIRHKFRKIEPV